MPNALGNIVQGGGCFEKLNDSMVRISDTDGCYNTKVRSIPVGDVRCKHRVAPHTKELCHLERNSSRYVPCLAEMTKLVCNNIIDEYAQQIEE